MEDDFLRGEVLKVLSRYDPELAADVALDEFGRIVQAALSYKAGYTGPMKGEGDGWHPKPPSVMNKFNRAQVCLAKAVRDEVGDAYVYPIGEGAQSPLFARIDSGEVKLLDAAGSGVYMAQVLCAIHFYLRALRDLSCYPAIRKNEILSSLRRAGEIFPCPDIEIAVERVNELFRKGSENGLRDRASEFRRVVLYIAAAAVVLAPSVIWFLENPSSHEWTIAEGTAPADGGTERLAQMPQIDRRQAGDEPATGADGNQPGDVARTADEIFEKYRARLNQSVVADDPHTAQKIFSQMMEETSRNGFSFEAFRSDLTAVVDRRDLSYYRTLRDYVSGEFSNLEVLVGYVESDVLSLSPEEWNRHSVVSDVGTVTLYSGYETVVVSCEGGAIEQVRSLAGLTCQFFLVDGNLVKVAGILKKPSISRLQDKIYDCTTNPGFILVSLPGEPEVTQRNNSVSGSNASSKAKISGSTRISSNSRRHRYSTRRSFGPPSRDSF